MSYLSEQELSDAARREEEEAVRRMLEKNAGMRASKKQENDIDLSTFNEEVFPKNSKYKYFIIGIVIFLAVIITFAFIFKEKFVKPEEVNAPIETNNNL